MTATQTYFLRADALMRKGEKAYDDLVATIESELRHPNNPQPMVEAVFDQRDHSIEEMLKDLKEENPYKYCRETMWEEYNNKDITGAFIYVTQPMSSISGMQNNGIYIYSGSSLLDSLRTGFYALSDEMGKAIF